jgi:hypothetical protein
MSPLIKEAGDGDAISAEDLEAEQVGFWSCSGTRFDIQKMELFCKVFVAKLVQTFQVTT